MSDVGGVRVTDDVVGPLMTGGIGVAGADVFLLEMLELLEGAKFVGHVLGKVEGFLKGEKGEDER